MGVLLRPEKLVLLQSVKGRALRLNSGVSSSCPFLELKSPISIIFPNGSNQILTRHMDQFRSAQNI